jgi:hypothetical protein
VVLAAVHDRQVHLLHVNMRTEPMLPIGTDRASSLQLTTQKLTYCLPVPQEQAAKAADVAAEVEQEAASLRAASNSAQEDSLAAAAALARLGEDLRKSEVSRDVSPNRIHDTCCEAAFNTLCCLRGPRKERGQS